MTEDEMFGWHHQLNGHEFEQTLGDRWRNNGNSDRLYFLWVQKSLQMVTADMKLRDACSLEEKL